MVRSARIAARSDEATKLKGKTTRPGLWKCRACRKPFTVRMGTVFESSHVPMHIWLQAIYLMCASKKGIATRQLHRTFGGSLKTAWFLGHRIREAMTVLNIGDFGGRSAAQIRLSKRTKLSSAARRATAKARSRRKRRCCRWSSVMVGSAASTCRT